MMVMFLLNPSDRFSASCHYGCAFAIGFRMVLIGATDINMLLINIGRYLESRRPVEISPASCPTFLQGVYETKDANASTARISMRAVD